MNDNRADDAPRHPVLVHAACQRFPLSPRSRDQFGAADRL